MKIKNNLTPNRQFDKKCKIFLINDSKRPTYNYLRRVLTFKTCLRKLTIIAPFIPCNNLLFYFFLNQKIKKNQKKEKRREKNRTIFFCLIFRNCPQKGAKWDAVNIVNALKVFFEEDEAEEATRKKFKI